LAPVRKNIQAAPEKIEKRAGSSTDLSIVGYIKRGATLMPFLPAANKNLAGGKYMLTLL